MAFSSESCFIFSFEIFSSTRALENLQTCDISYCSGCKLVKFSSLPFNRSISVSSSPFGLIHFDVWGPSSVATKGGSWYYVSFIHGHTRYYWVYLMKHCSEFFEIYTAFRALVKTQHSVIIKCFRCDFGRNTPLINFMSCCLRWNHSSKFIYKYSWAKWSY
jgi:hypothetical protein